jgi:hypothetical protein
MYLHCGNTHTVGMEGPVQPLPLLSLTPLSASPHFQQLSVHILISYIFISYVILLMFYY